MVDKSKILSALKEYSGFKTDAEFAKFLGISPQNLSKWHARNTFDVDKIVNLFPNISKIYLLTGEGDMIKNTDGNNMLASELLSEYHSKCSNKIPLLPITAQGGSLSEFCSSVQRYQCEAIISPIENAEMAIVVRGESMEPEYKDGSIVLLRKIQHEVYIDWGSVYVIDTTNGAILKQVAPGSKEELIRLHSFNPASEYADYEIQKSVILAMYKVIFVMAAKSY